MESRFSDLIESSKISSENHDLFDCIGNQSKNDEFELKQANSKDINQLIEIIEDLNIINTSNSFDLKQEKAKLQINPIKDNDEYFLANPKLITNQNQQIFANNCTNTTINQPSIDNNSNNSQQSLCSSGATSTTSMNSRSNRDSLNSASSFNQIYNINDVTAAASSTDPLVEINSCMDQIEESYDKLNIVDNNNNDEQNIFSKLPQNDHLIIDNTHENQENEIVIETQRQHLDEEDETYDDFDVLNLPKPASSGTLKRTQLINLIFDLYDLNNYEIVDESPSDENSVISNAGKPVILIEGFMEKLPPGKNLKNSLLLAWRKRYFKLSSIGNLYEYDIDERSLHLISRFEPNECYCLMGGRVEYEQNKAISLDDCRGNCLVIRCCNSDKTNLKSQEELDELFMKWKIAIDSQIIDRSELLWVRPNHPLTDINSLTNLNRNMKSNFDQMNKKVLIVDIGTCSIRAGLFGNEPKLPKLFIPTVCAKDLNNNRYKVGFDAFDFLMSSSAPSTIDLHKSMSTWSLASTCSPLIFPLKTRGSIDKLNFDIDSIEAILAYVVETLNLSCPDHQIVVVTTHKLTDKTNIQFLNMLLTGSKFNFKSATIINQTLLTLYSYNSNVGVVANLGEKIDIVPICNGVSFQSGVTNLAYGGTTMSEYLNSFISRGHINYVNDMEQYYVRYIKEKSCYAALNYQDELKKYQNDNIKFTLDLQGHANELKKVEFPESARFKSVEGLFNPEIWGIDGQGIHKLIFKAIQSTSMDLRREMARSIYLCGGMSRIPGLKERLEKELKILLPPALKVKVNCSDYSYHSAYLGAFRFIQQPEYEKLLISKDEWAKESVNCLRKWRMM